VPGGTLSFLAGIGDSFMNLLDLGDCMAEGSISCEQNMASGDTYSGQYTNWIARHGIDTAPRSTYTGGKWAGFVFQMAAGGPVSAVGTGAEAAADLSTAAESSPADLAAAFQGRDAYRGVDAWQNVTLQAGTKVYAGEPGVSGFFTSEGVAESVGNDATALNEGLQIVSRTGMYRPGLTEFTLTQDVQAARSIALANPQYGAGGLEQFFIPNWSDIMDPMVSKIMQNRVVP
jgi:hypothetical protein